MKNTTITTINNIAITISEGDKGILVPIKPICEALGVAFRSQYEKIKNDEILGSTVMLSMTVGADNKEREMVCLPSEYIFGWLFTINPNNVNPDARETVISYKHECYHALYNYFFEKSEKYQAREKSLERTIGLQTEQATIRANPYKTAADFDRYLEIEFELGRETAIRKSMTRDSISNIKTLFE